MLTQTNSKTASISPFNFPLPAFYLRVPLPVPYPMVITPEQSHMVALSPTPSLRMTLKASSTRVPYNITYT